MRKFLVVIGTAFLASPTMAATQTVVLSVPAISCSACYTRIKAALSKVKGVNQTQVVLEKRQAVVCFDETQTPVQALIRATSGLAFRRWS